MTLRILRGLGGLTLVLATGSLLGARPATAFHEATVHVEARVWFPALEAEARASAAGAAGDLLTGGDLGASDPDLVAGGAAMLRLGRHWLRVEGFRFDVEGDTRISRSFTFDGRRYDAGIRVRSDADVVFAGADYGLDVVRGEVGAAGITLGARLVSAEATLRAVELGFQGNGAFDAVLPAVGLHAVVHPVPVPLLSGLALTGRVTGGTIGDRGRFIDAEAAIEWLPIPLLSVRIGYRYFHGRGEDGGDEARIELAGPYVGVTLAF